jgi:hypothetical protein
MSRYAALAGRIRTSLVDIQNAVERAIMLADKATKTGDDGYWDGVALNLHGYYTGVERIFEDIARTMEANLPTGSDWHLDLLTQMSSEIEGIRPAVISRSTRECLDEYRGFRHVVRNIYTFNLRPARLRELVDGLYPCYQSVMTDLGAFIALLNKLD